MDFKDKYTNPIEKDVKKEEISKDTYAICEVLQELNFSINRLVEKIK